jgi:hypothetical protein
MDGAGFAQAQPVGRTHALPGHLIARRRDPEEAAVRPNAGRKD